MTTSYDTWARVATYTDATGLTSETTYTIDGQIDSLDDGVGTTTYAYDETTGENRRVPTTIDVGLASGLDQFTMTWTAAGAPARVTYPNGTVADRYYDEADAPVGLAYSADDTVLLAFVNTLDVDGRTIAATSPASAQDYTFDRLNRLTKVEDTRNDESETAACTTRVYGFSAASERTSLTTYGPSTTTGSEGACQTSAPVGTKTNSYDSANRITNTGYDYDNLGRTLTVPAAETAAGTSGDLTASYHANDMIKALEQDTQSVEYSLDPTGRINKITHKTNGSETNRLRYRFSLPGDSPTSVQESSDAGSSWASTRYVAIPSLGMAGSVDPGGNLILQISNLHGDIVARQDPSGGGGQVVTYAEADEYGNQTSSGQALGRFGWLGSYQRSRDSIKEGLVAMGARQYNPATGHFLTQDPILGGGANQYGYPTDPVNQYDLTGEYWWGGFKGYTGLFTIWVRIWLNRNALSRLSQHAVSTGAITQAVAAALAFAPHAAAKLAAKVVGLMGAIQSALGVGMSTMLRNGYGIGIRIIFVRSTRTFLYMYAYRSEYAYGYGL